MMHILNHGDKMTVDFYTKIATRNFVRRGTFWEKPIYQLSVLFWSLWIQKSRTWQHNKFFKPEKRKQ